MPSPDSLGVAVLREKAHGHPISEFVAALRERLSDDHEIRAARTPAEERELVAEAPVVVGGEIDADLLAAAENLEWFACSSAGVGHLPDALAERGVTVTNASGVHGPNIAEHALGSMLAVTRSFDEGWRRQREREWRHYQAFGELNGSTVTVVGLGAIGTTLVERLSGFDIHTIGVRYTPSKGGPTDEVLGFGDEDGLYDAFARSDYLVLACPLTDTTRGLIDGEAFATLPADAVLVNVGRGPLVDTNALTAALRDNEIHAAAVDVTDPEPLPEEHPLWGLDNAMITPHMAGDTDAYWERLADIVAENVEHVVETGSYDGLRNQVEL
jgi:phosphoglycerate dehydrogenase-like enzyme